MSNLRTAVIRLAHENPELRKDLIPLLKQASVFKLKKGRTKPYWEPTEQVTTSYSLRPHDPKGGYPLGQNWLLFYEAGRGWVLGGPKGPVSLRTKSLYDGDKAQKEALQYLERLGDWWAENPPSVRSAAKKDLPVVMGIRKPWYQFSDGVVSLDEVGDILSEDRAVQTKVRMINTLRKKLLDHLNDNYIWD